jgi:hypothetical protein
MAKAFDIISHGFLNDCYTFFNFGPNFQNMLKTVGNSRTACIIMDDGSLSENFNLESCRPQGKILSQVQYNIGEQIFLLKIELDPNIKSLFSTIFGPQTPFSIPNNFQEINAPFRLESERETNKAEGFADDATVITTADQESISHVENIVEKFHDISGLKCNFSKSSIMFFGEKNNNLVTRFQSVNKVTLLGIEIDNELNQLSQNFSKAKKTFRKLSIFGIALILL